MHLIAVGQILIYLLPLHLLLADSFTYTGIKMHCLNSTILTLSSETLQFSFYGNSQPPGASLYWLIFSPLLYTESITSKHNRIYICTQTNRKLLVLS